MRVMPTNLIKSLIIGSILGIVIGLSKVDSSGIGTIFSLCCCVMLGLVTVLSIDEKPHLYSLPATLASSIFLCAFYGFKLGVTYTLGVAWVYGIFSVQLFQAILVSSENIKSLLEKFLKKK